MTARTAATLNELSDGTLGYQLVLAESTPTLLAFPRRLLLGLVLGMLGDSCTELPAERELTVVEESLTEFLLQQSIQPVLLETWPGGEPLSVRLGGKEPRPRFTRMFGSEPDLVTFSFVVRGPFGEQQWLWLTPQSFIYKHFRVSPPAETPGKGKLSQAAQSELLVRQLPVELAVLLGRAELSVSSLAQLQVGDLLVLDRRISESLEARVSGRNLFRVWPGRKGNRQAIRVESSMER
jgi:flagellar motor switch protein FliM